jgi:cytochrome c
MIKVFKIALLSGIVLSMVFSIGFSMKHLPEERGKALFENVSFANGKRACNTCHPGGRGLEKAGTKAEFHIMGKVQKSLEEAVNFCIVNANKGEAIDENSDEMKDIVAYIKSLEK